MSCNCVKNVKNMSQSYSPEELVVVVARHFNSDRIQSTYSDKLQTVASPTFSDKVKALCDAIDVYHKNNRLQKIAHISDIAMLVEKIDHLTISEISPLPISDTFLKGDSSPSCAFKPLATQDQSDEESMDKHEEGGNTLSHDSLTPQIFDTKRRTEPRPPSASSADKSVMSETEAPKKQPTLGTSRAQTHASRYDNMFKLDEVKRKKHLEIIKHSKTTEQTLSENTLNELKKEFTEYLAENSSLDTASLTSLTADASFTQEKSLEEDVKLSQYIHGTKAAVSYLLLI